MGRQLQVPLGASGCAYFSFEDLCDRPLGAVDYFGLFKKFHTLALEGVPKFGLHNRTTAYRFVTLVDKEKLGAEKLEEARAKIEASVKATEAAKQAFEEAKDAPNKAENVVEARTNVENSEKDTEEAKKKLEEAKVNYERAKKVLERSQQAEAKRKEFEADAKLITLDEYLKTKTSESVESKNAEEIETASEKSPKTEKSTVRKVSIDKEFDGMRLVARSTEEDHSIKLESDKVKPKKKTPFESKERIRKSLSIDEFLYIHRDAMHAQGSEGVEHGSGSSRVRYHPRERADSGVSDPGYHSTQRQAMDGRGSRQGRGRGEYGRGSNRAGYYPRADRVSYPQHLSTRSDGCGDLDVIFLYIFFILKKKAISRETIRRNR